MGDFIETVNVLVGHAPVPDWLAWILVVSIVLIVVVSIAKAFRLAGEAITTGWSRFSTWFAAQSALRGRIETARDAVMGDGMWVHTPPSYPERYPRDCESSIPILIVANLKGGVGKTTISGNLGAYYADKENDRGERVLLIDLDYQGSLSILCLDRGHINDDGVSRASELVLGEIDARTLADRARPVGESGALSIIDASFDLAQIENRLLVHWLIGETKADIRYALHRVLRHRDVQRKFDRIIIDCPPRLTTACVQALACATHVLIPTPLTNVSAQTVRNFLNQLRRASEIWPHLKHISVAGVLTHHNVGAGRNLTGDEETQLKFLEAELARFGTLGEVRPTLLHRATFIPRRQGIANRSSAGPSYYAAANQGGNVIRDIFKRLGDALREKEMA